MTPIILASAGLGLLGLVSAYGVYRLGKWLWPSPKCDDQNPFMYEETDPYIIALQRQIAKAQAKHKPVIHLYSKLSKARHDKLREEITQ